MTNLNPRAKGSRLAPLFEARSIAIVGASEDPTKQSALPMLNLLKHDYPGLIFPINPRHQVLMGRKCYPSLRAVGQAIDLTLVMVPAARVVLAVQEGIDAGSRSFIIYAGGFAEKDQEGARWQSQLTHLARTHGVCIVGPNCNGMISSHARMSTAIAGVMLPGMREGTMAFAGQSGAMGAYWLQLTTNAGMGFSKWIATGNEADIGIADVIEYLAADDHTRTICLYLEGARNARALREALQSARNAGKTVLALRAGRSAQGAAAAMSHTGAIAGDERMWSALFERTGVLAFDSLVEMIDAMKLMATDPLPCVGRPIVMSISGGAGAMTTDLANAKGMSLPKLSDATLARLAKTLPSFGTPGNPLDLTGSMAIDTNIFVEAAKAVANDEGADSFLVFLGLLSAAHRELIAAIKDILCATGKPCAVVWSAAQAQVEQALIDAGIAHYPDIPQAVSALAAWCRISSGPSESVPPANGMAFASRTGAATYLSEVSARELMGRIEGLSWPQGVLIRSPQEIEGALAQCKYPAAAKIQSPDMPHKTEHGGICLNLKDAAAAGMACKQLFATAQRLGVRLDGVLLQEMVAHEHELIVGIRGDAVFGPALVLGRGGTEAEYDPDVAIALLPVSPQQIESALKRLRYGARLAGVRGRAGVDLSSLAQCIAALCDRYLSDERIAEIEINPLAASAPNRFVALDLLASQSMQNEPNPGTAHRLVEP